MFLVFFNYIHLQFEALSDVDGGHLQGADDQGQYLLGAVDQAASLVLDQIGNLRVQ